MKAGDKASFKKSWKSRDEACYAHWAREEPQNQVQLAFRNHWTLFRELMKNKMFNGGKRCLEVGCGRGTISAYFGDAGFKCTLLDISETVIAKARKFFKSNGLSADFRVGDAIDLPFDDGKFDIVVSIGLLEHFEDIEAPIAEQIRVLAPGGLLLCYVVPKYEDNVQESYNWINEILKGYARSSETAFGKEELFRSDDGSEKYTKLLKKENMRGVSARGVYPLPMISHSTEFPFTLMPEESEKVLVEHFQKILAKQEKKKGEHPWLCEEGYGQAFLAWGYK